jgi:hypothetical protein
MTLTLPFSRSRQQRLTTLLGLNLDGSRLDAALLRRTNGSVLIQQSLSIALSLDPLTADPALVGQEIRNHLDGAGIRERNCVLGLPLKWALTTHVDVPSMAPEDVSSFLQLEAERGFPCDASTLQIASSRCQESGDKQYALLVGVPTTHVTRLEQVLQAARLRPVSFTLGTTVLQSAKGDSAQGVLALVIGESHLALQLTTGGGVAALRTLEGAIELEGGRRTLHSDVIVREARITLGQLPAELREGIKRIRVFGPRDLAQQLADELELRLEHLQLAIEVVEAFAPGQFGVQLPDSAPVSSALALATARLAGSVPEFEFLPHHLSPLEQLAARYSSGKLRLAGGAAAAVAGVLLLIFLFQQLQLVRYQAQWSGMAAKVRELDQVQQQIHQYRPWMDENFRGLSMLKQLTMNFTDDGTVSARSIELRENGVVSCTGVARENQALLRTFEKISAAPGVSDFHRGQMRGKSPIQFTFDFRWTEGGTR